VRRLLILPLFAPVLASGAAGAWQAKGQATLVQQDLTIARDLLARAGGLQSGKLEARLHLIDRAEAHTLAAERRLARAQRQLSRKRKGSANRAKARRRVAVAHRRVRDRRADHHHKLALRLLRENQAVAVEDLAVAGLARTRLAKSVHDAGWAMFVRLLAEKAAHHGRRVIRIDRFEPTTQTCSACGRRDGPKPLDLRIWTCGACGTTHDRDVNAARNILVAAGLAETQTACGAGIRPPPVAAVGNEAGTHRGAA
jgi:putative transposase